jgi:hypothetical protein
MWEREEGQPRCKGGLNMAIGSRWQTARKEKTLLGSQDVQLSMEGFGRPLSPA